MPKKSETKNQTLPLDTLPGDWGTQEDIAELEREAEAARQVAFAAEAKVKAAKEAARKQTMKAIADQLTASGITIHDLASFMGIALESHTKEAKPKKEPAPPKFRNPETGETHSGRGQLPSWLKQARETGKLEEFRINK